MKPSAMSRTMVYAEPPMKTLTPLSYQDPPSAPAS
jgi:hypothetical protein